MKADHLIIGQGLAGSALALALQARGETVIVIDREDANSASRVAAGLVTTVAGMGMNPSWRQAAYLPESLAFYRALEARSGKQLFHPTEVLRLFNNEKQVRKFANKSASIQEWTADAVPEDLQRWNAPHGGFVMRQGGWLDTPLYLQVVRDLLGKSYQARHYDESQLIINENGIQYQEITAKTITLCQGISGLTSGHFSYLNHRSAKGEILRIRIPNKPQHQILNNNGWLVPLTAENQWKAGAPYEWSDMLGLTTEQGRAEVEQKIQHITGLTSDAYEVLDHTAGVRPIIRKSQPLIGAHPEYPSVYFFNGLGSKGVTTAPSVASHFAEHLTNGKPLDTELDLKKHTSKKPSNRKTE